MSAPSPAEGALTGYRIGVTAARKVEEQVTLLQRRGATVEWALALSQDPNRVDDEDLRAATREVLGAPVDMFVATTGIGMKAWFEAAETGEWSTSWSPRWSPPRSWPAAPRASGAAARRGLRELWAPESECFEDVLEHLRGRDLTGKRIVVQEHGQSLSMVAHALRRRGADVPRSPSTGSPAPRTPSRCSG